MILMCWLLCRHGYLTQMYWLFVT
uniref:Uncharacterized protein n=1 Tax=Arundo donax TaxID=35708 RepID=A0A0A9C1L9_ARUDO